MPTDGVAYVENPPFDPRIRHIPGVAVNNPMAEGGSTLFRGRIESKGKVNGFYRRLNFLYNPSGIQWSGNVDTDTIGDQSVQDPLDVGTFMMPMSQTVSFSLLFDRTYETWVYDARKETSRLGVVADIKHFYAMLGILGEGTAFKAQGPTPDTGSMGEVESSTVGNATIADTLTGLVDVGLIDDASPTSFMQYIPVRVIFGKHLSYHGVISSATISYTHFTQRMIPNRCSLEIGMQLFPVTRSEVEAGTRAAPLAGYSEADAGHTGASRRAGR